jgi:hypothetical protein
MNDSSEPFTLQQYMMLRHPNGMHTAFLQGGFLDLIPVGGAVQRYDLNAFPRAVWVRLEDPSGGWFPISVLISPEGIPYAVWDDVRPVEAAPVSAQVDASSAAEQLADQLRSQGFSIAMEGLRQQILLNQFKK